jgi:hypothetical protein
MPGHVDNEFDLMQLGEMRNSRGWLILSERVRDSHARWVRELIAANNEVTRGKIQAAELFLGLPEQLEKEARQAMERRK